MSFPIQLGDVVVYKNSAEFCQVIYKIPENSAQFIILKHMYILELFKSLVNITTDTKIGTFTVFSTCFQKNQSRPRYKRIIIDG